MIKEAYVSFEVAKLLKEKGFNESCWLKYDNEGYLSFNHVGYINSEEPCDDFCALAPTHQMAMKWLREKYYIHADPIKQGNYNDCSEYYSWIVSQMGIIHRNPSVADKLSYEEAVEAALKYVLKNLI